MTTNFDEFWNRAGPGLLDLGVGLYNKRAGQKEAAQRLATAQGPLYQQAMGGAGATLAEAGMLNPDALAASRFTAQEAMLKPVQDKQLADLQRMLYSRGMLGAANYNPGVEGIIPSGQAMNPQMAAFFAAQNADRRARAQAALGQGQEYANTLVNRAGALQRVAGGTQQTGLTAQGTQPSRATATGELLRGITRNPNIFRDIWNVGSGLFRGGLDWLGGQPDLASQFGGAASW